MTDFIVVGRGLAANVLAHTLYQQKISFKIIGNQTLSTCSSVAAGIWNPIVFKRLTKSWLADELIDYLTDFYSDCEITLGKKIITKRTIAKPFTEEQEKDLWLKKANHELENFLDPRIYEPSNDLTHFKIPNGFGLVKNCGNLNVAEFLNQSTVFFKDFISDEIFDYNQLQLFPDKIIYNNIEAKQIIFCEGYLIKNNPFFNWIPLKPAKGEVFSIKVPELKIKNSVFNKNGFLMDMEDGTYKVGATYAWDDLEQEPTKKGADELDSKIKHMIDCDYSLVKHEAGVRPSSIDRRPIIGPHPIYSNLHVFNGLGTKGVMLAPYFAKNFVNFYLQKETIHNDVDVKRFYHLCHSKK